jgi:TPR repeat protein
LALCYDHGTGVAKDEKKAFEWYSAAAAKQHAKAAYNQGLCYRYGRGVHVDLVKAAAAYEASARQGYVLAQYNLAAAYSDGKGVMKDQKKAAEWYAKAADQKYPNAEYNLAVYYVHGTGVPKDDARAFALFSSAAAAGNARAPRWLALMSEEGKAPIEHSQTQQRRSSTTISPTHTSSSTTIGTSGVADHAKAFEYMKLAANQGDAVAQYRLGQWYRVGRPDLPRNEQLSLAYLKAAADQGHPGATLALKEIRATF